MVKIYRGVFPVKQNKWFMTGRPALKPAFGLVLAGRGNDGGEISKLLGTWVKADGNIWVFEDAGKQVGIMALTSSMGVLGVESYDGATLTFSNGQTCPARIEGNVLTISGLKSRRESVNGSFTRQ
jgi:hypothetical protein